MKTPRYLQLIAILCATLVALPPAFAMDVMERIISTQTQFARHEATEYQRKVAEAHARAYMAAQLRAYRHTTKVAVEPTSKPGKTSKVAVEPTPKPGKTAKVAPTPEPKKQEVTEKESQGPATVEEKRALKKKLPRYIAVETPTDKRSAPGTKKDVMIWDTQNESIVGNNVYDMPSSPPLGSTSRFDTYSAQYVGNGL